MASWEASIGLKVESGKNHLPRYNSVTERDEWVTEETGTITVSMNRKPFDSEMAIIRGMMKKGTREVIAVHLGNLALHKRIVKLGESGIEALIEDCARILADDFSELAVMRAIDEIKRNDESDFFPQLATIRKLSDAHQKKITAIFEYAEAMKNPKPKIQQQSPQKSDIPAASEWNKLEKAKWTDDHWLAYIAHARHLLAIKDAGTGFFTTSRDELAGDLAKREAEYAGR